MTDFLSKKNSIFYRVAARSGAKFLKIALACFLVLFFEVYCVDKAQAEGENVYDYSILLWLVSPDADYPTVDFMYDLSFGSTPVNIQRNNLLFRNDPYESSAQGDIALVGYSGGGTHYSMFALDGYNASFQFANSSRIIFLGSQIASYALDGGVFFVNGGSTLNLTNSWFLSNQAANGGAIYLGDGVVNIFPNELGAIFSYNSASNQGGAIYNAGTINLYSQNGPITFSGNSPNDIYNDGETLNFYTSADYAISLDGGIAGTGTINKYNVGSLNLGGNNSGYTGAFNQAAGETYVPETGFNGSHTITGGILIFGTSSLLGSSSSYNIGSSGNITFQQSERFFHKRKHQRFGKHKQRRQRNLDDERNKFRF